MAVSLTDGLRTGVRQGVRLSVAARSAYDAAAVAYFTAVEAADGQTLETNVKVAINNFIVGCKADGTWNAIKASCILAGARTLSGALVPLAGTAPTNFNFVSGDYDRKTGLIGNGSTKYLDTNRSATADPLLNCHASAWASSGPVSIASVGATIDGAVVLAHGNPAGGRLRNNVFTNSTLNGLAPSFLGLTRTLTTGFTLRTNSASEFLTATANNNAGIGNYVTHRFAGTNYYNSRLAFYSIGEALDLALLDARVTALMTAISAAVQDPSYANVSLLLHGDGANGSTTITDSSPSPKTVTAVGNVQISTAQSKFGGASIAFDGNGDFISSANNAAFSYGTGDFTVESWIYANAFSNFNVWLDHRANGGSFYGFAIVTSSSGVLSLYSGTSFVVSSSALSTGQWYHWAASRSGSTVRLFINGQLASSATFTANLSDSGFVAGKTNESLANYVNGYIDDLRITKGVARYTANFTPPAAPFSDS